jgi:hypothetical protein
MAGGAILAGVAIAQQAGVIEIGEDPAVVTRKPTPPSRLTFPRRPRASWSN